MRRFILIVVLAAGVFLAVRMMSGRVGRGVSVWCADVCDRMLANMPEAFPPNRIMADLESIKEQNEQILELLNRGPGSAAPDR